MIRSQLKRHTPLKTHKPLKAKRWGIKHINLAYGAWKRDPEYFRLWGSLNLSLCMWLWRRVVVEGYSAKSVRMTAPQFGKCLMSLSASSDYLDWLVGRGLGERDRSPAYSRIRAIFAKRYEDETGKRASFPSPPWYQNRGV